KLSESNQLCGLDLETTGLDPYKDNLMLLILGNKDCKLVFDATIYYGENLRRMVEFFTLFKDVYYIGQNLKFDYSFIKTKFGIELLNLVDIMIIDQRIYQNSKFSMGLKALVERHLNLYPEHMDKDVRMEFLYMDKTNPAFKE